MKYSIAVFPEGTSLDEVLARIHDFDLLVYTNTNGECEAVILKTNPNIHAIREASSYHESEDIGEYEILTFDDSQEDMIKHYKKVLGEAAVSVEDPTPDHL